MLVIYSCQRVEYTNIPHIDCLVKPGEGCWVQLYAGVKHHTLFYVGVKIFQRIFVFLNRKMILIYSKVLNQISKQYVFLQVQQYEYW